MLATLVVNLKANYGNLTAGMATARNQTVVAVDGIKASVANLKTVEPQIAALETRAHRVASALETAAYSARMLASGTNVVSSGLRAASGGVLHFIHQLHAARIVISLLTTAFHMLMVPIRLIGSAAALVFRVLAVALRTVLLPVRILWAALSGVARVVWALVGPIAAVAMTVFKVWFIFKGWIGALKVLWNWLSMLPPKVRLLVVGLLALGAAGKAGALALRVFATAVRVAATAMQILLLPIQLIRNPMAALRSAANLLGRALMTAGNMARSAASGFYSFAKSVGSSTMSVVGAIGTRLVSAAKAGASALLALGVAASAWGIKLAAKAETAEVIFGTMLKNMSAGKALQTELENWSGAPLFDPDAIQLSGMLLYKAGISAKDITGKLDQLGQIAAATKTPIDDLARIYQQGMNQGAFQQDKINQLSDRGIAIYEGLAHATGVSGAALKKMIADGKIGPEEMNAALTHLTEGQGIYAGAVQNMGQTTEGMWKSLTNKVGFAARELGINLMDAFDFKGMMKTGIEFFSNLRGHIANAMPAFKAIATVVTAAFSAVWEIVSVVFTSITGAMGVTGDNWMTTFMEWTAIATWAFKNWPDIATLAFVNVGLSLVRFGADCAHLFTGVMPALFGWFGDNWANLFTDAASFVGTVFSNMATNIKSAMKGIWDYIASGGKTPLTFAWKPLLDGFQSTVTELKDVPPRAIGELEAQLAADSERLGESLGSSLQTEIDANMKMLADFQAAQANYVPPTLDGLHPPEPTPGGDEDPDAGKGAEDKKVGALAKGSQEAASAIFAAMRQKDNAAAKIAAKQLQVQQQQLAAANLMNARMNNAQTLAFVETLA